MEKGPFIVVVAIVDSLNCNISTTVLLLPLSHVS